MNRKTLLLQDYPFELLISSGGRLGLHGMTDLG